MNKGLKRVERQILCDMSVNLSLEDMEDIDRLKSSCRHALRLSNIKVAKNPDGTDLILEKNFKPQGITLIFLLEESHFTLHTYPEHRGITIDLSSCGDKSDPMKAISYLSNEFEMISSNTRTIDRGIPQYEI